MPEDVKLLMLTHNYPRFKGDFAGIFIALLARRLPEHGIEPIILAPHAPGLPEHETMDGVKVHRFRYASREEDENLAYHGSMHKLVLGSAGGVFKFKHFLDSFRQAANEIAAKERVDALAGHWLVPSGMVMKTINRKLKLPTFMYSHGTDVRLARKYFRAVYRYLRGFCLGLRRWTVVSSYLKNEIIAMDSRLEDIIDVLPVPHDEATFYADGDIICDDDLIVSVTRFTQQKRVEQLIRAFALVSEQRPAARLAIYGGGPMRNEIDRLIIKLGLADKVLIHEPVPQPQLREVYNRAAAVVLNSVQEGFGLALSEAMLCGTAVIGANSGGITDIIEHERTGLLVEPDKADDLAQAMLRLLGDKSFREQLAGAGYKHALASYASSSLAAKYAAMVRQGLA